MPSEVEKQNLPNDAFISYSRRDIEFARKLEKALEDYKPPKDLNVPQRRLEVFRDKEDFTGVEYYESIEKHLKNSRKMIVICSPNARKRGRKKQNKQKKQRERPRRQKRFNALWHQ